MSQELTVPGKVPAIRRRSDTVGELIGAFESDTTAVLLRIAPRRVSITMYVFLGMLTLGIVLSCIVKLDRVVTSVAGIIVTSEGTIYVSALNPSVIKSVDVKVHQIVKKGQGARHDRPNLYPGRLAADAGTHGQ
jgi:hypothetical protein